MARIRSVKPALRISRVVAGWPIPARYAWVLLWGYLDDYGRGIDDVRLIVADCFPLDREVTERKMESWLRLYSTAQPEKPAPLCRYTVAGQTYLHSLNWHEHQRVNRPTPSVIPPCPLHESFSERLSEPDSEGSVSDSLRARKEMEEVLGVGDGTGDGGGGGGVSGGAAASLVAEWIDHCSGGRPPERVVGQVAREVGAMVAQGIPVPQVRQGLAAWHAKGLHPSTLASVVHEHRTAADRRTTSKASTTDDRVGAGLSIAETLRSAEAGHRALGA